jgi:hypothetical protein
MKNLKLVFALALALAACSETDDPKPNSQACEDARFAENEAEKAVNEYTGTDRAVLANYRKILAAATEHKNKTCN